MGQQAELAHLFRALKAPAAARALPKLADRARQEEWSYERFVQTLLETEVSARDSHGGEARIRQARFPARKTLEEFDLGVSEEPCKRGRKDEPCPRELIAIRKNLSARSEATLEP